MSDNDQPVNGDSQAIIDFYNEFGEMAEALAKKHGFHMPKGVAFSEAGVVYVRSAFYQDDPEIIWKKAWDDHKLKIGAHCIAEAGDKFVDPEGVVWVLLGVDFSIMASIIRVRNAENGMEGVFTPDYFSTLFPLVEH